MPTPSFDRTPPRSIRRQSHAPAFSTERSRGTSHTSSNEGTPQLPSLPKSSTLRVRQLAHVVETSEVLANTDSNSARDDFSDVFVSPEVAQSPLGSSPAHPAMPPTRQLRSTPARLASASKRRQEQEQSGRSVSTPSARTPSRGSKVRATTPISSASAEASSPDRSTVLRSESFATNVGRQPVAPLQFGDFPAVFQSGIGAEQLQLLHTILSDASAPMPLDGIMDAVPISCKKLDRERVKLLLEVRVARLPSFIDGTPPS